MRELSHPFVLSLQYTFQTPEHLHMVMELIENGDLSQYLDHSQFIEEPSAKFITAELILGIQYVHSKNSFEFFSFSIQGSKFACKVALGYTLFHILKLLLLDKEHPSTCLVRLF